MIVCSFSGGETSGYMAFLLKKSYPDTSFVFANTGQENEETLDFIEACDNAFDLGVTWIESVPNMEKGKGSGYRIVDYKTASRRGEPFEQVIRGYGIPNPDWPHCTRELKEIPMKKWANDCFEDYVFAIGIRSDEIDRINPSYKERGLTYPLIFEWPTTKPQVNRFWRDMPFRLNLKGYQGNCKWCWKKSLRKHLTIMNETPEYFDFPEKMESIYSKHALKDYEKERVFFRRHMRVDDIREMAKTNFIPAQDDSDVYELQEGFDFDLDRESSCGSRCEVFSDDESLIGVSL